MRLEFEYEAKVCPAKISNAVMENVNVQILQVNQFSSLSLNMNHKNDVRYGRSKNQL